LILNQLQAVFIVSGERGICTYPSFLLYFDILRVFNSVLTELLTTLNLVWYSCKCYIQI